MKCKTCGKRTHYCSSCGYDPYMFEGYCNKDCWEASEGYKMFKKKLEFFWTSLNREQQSELFALWGNDILIDNMWKSTIDKIFVKSKEK